MDSRPQGEEVLGVKKVADSEGRELEMYMRQLATNFGPAMQQRLASEDDTFKASESLGRPCAENPCRLTSFPEYKIFFFEKKINQKKKFFYFFFL